MDPSDGSLYVADNSNHRVLRFIPGRPDGILVAGGSGSGPAVYQLKYPNGLALDRDGSLYVADSGNHRIMRFTRGEATGQVVAGGNGRGDGMHQLDEPYCITLEMDGALLVADYNNHRVMRFRINENSALAVGELVAGGRGAGSGLMELKFPVGIALAPSGETEAPPVTSSWQPALPPTLARPIARGPPILIADCMNHRIVRLRRGSNARQVVVGSAGPGEELNQLSFPFGLALEADGSLLVADCSNNRILRYSADSQVGEVVAGGKGAGDRLST